MSIRRRPGIWRSGTGPNPRIVQENLAKLKSLSQPAVPKAADTQAAGVPAAANTGRAPDLGYGATLGGSNVAGAATTYSLNREFGEVAESIKRDVATVVESSTPTQILFEAGEQRLAAIGEAHERLNQSLSSMANDTALAEAYLAAQRSVQAVVADMVRQTQLSMQASAEAMQDAKTAQPSTAHLSACAPAETQVPAVFVPAVIVPTTPMPHAVSPVLPQVPMVEVPTGLRPETVPIPVVAPATMTPVDAVAQPDSADSQVVQPFAPVPVEAHHATIDSAGASAAPQSVEANAVTAEAESEHVSSNAAASPGTGEAVAEGS